MRKLSLSGRKVLITGAARGLGKQIAVHLAKNEGANLVLVGRNPVSLNDLGEEISKRCFVKTRIMVKDLLAEHSAQSLYDELKDDDIYGLVNNAGLTYYGESDASHIDLFRSIINLDFRLVVELSLLFFSKFKAEGEGFILNVTSLASFAPIPYQAVYAAAKGAAQSFTECLYQENRGCPVFISTFAPAGILTDMIHKSGLTLHMERYRHFYLTPESAARAVIRGLKRGKRLIIPGLMNRLIYLFMNVLPRHILVRMAGKIYNYEKYRTSDVGRD